MRTSREGNYSSSWSAPAAPFCVNAHPAASLYQKTELEVSFLRIAAPGFPLSLAMALCLDWQFFVDSWTCSISITWELLQMQTLRSCPRVLNESGHGAQPSVPQQVLQVILMQLKLENHCSGVGSLSVLLSQVFEKKREDE